MSNRYEKAFRNDAIFLGVCVFTLCVLAFTMIQVYELENSVPEEITVYHDGNDNTQSPYPLSHGKVVMGEQEIDESLVPDTITFPLGMSNRS